MDWQFENFKRSDVVVGYKAKFSLIALWIFAGIVFVIMFLFNSTSIGSYIIGRESNLITFPLAGENEELNIFNTEKSSKKFFLTRVPSGQADQINKAEQMAINVLVIKKVKIRSSKSSDGFQIKPYPKK
jgi:hypothetical protein